MESDKKPILQLDEISKIYKSKTSFFGGTGIEVVALNQVSLNIFKGEIFGLVGESGSGKTTAGRLIAKLEDPAAGRIFLDGYEITTGTNPLNPNDYLGVPTPEPESILLEIVILIFGILIAVALIVHGFLRRSRPVAPPTPAPKEVPPTPKKTVPTPKTTKSTPKKRTQATK